MRKTKSIISIILLFSFAGFLVGSVLAETSPNSEQDQGKPQMTAEQQACIKTAQEKRDAAISAAKKDFDSATKDALAKKNELTKKAIEDLKTAIKIPSEIRKKVIADAQKNPNKEVRDARIKAANDAYNNDEKVKKAKAKYDATLKEINNAYDNDQTVKKAKPLYAEAVKAANDQFQLDRKACLEGKGAALKIRFFERIKNSVGGFFTKISGFFVKIGNFFKAKK